MLCVISPAKSLDFTPVDAALKRSEPIFLEDAAQLAKSAGRLSRARLKALMELSDDLAALNYERFKAFDAEPSAEKVKQAALAFSGDTYTGLDYGSLNAEAMDYAQGNLRILSGLYGVLRPMDVIQPYRLEMGRKLKTGRAESLYEYWGERIASAVDSAAKEAGASFILNAASQEYFRATREDALKTPVITPVFLDEKNGAAKTIGFYAKRARGAISRFVLENRIKTVEELAGFDWDGYRFQPGEGDVLRPVFLRAERMAA